MRKWASSPFFGSKSRFELKPNVISTHEERLTIAGVAVVLKKSTTAAPTLVESCTFLLRDHLGSVTAVVNEAKAVVARYSGKGGQAIKKGKGGQAIKKKCKPNSFTFSRLTPFPRLGARRSSSMRVD